MRQRWRDVLFAHWPIPRKMLRPLVPEPLQLEEHEGNCWIGIVPFAMECVTWRPLRKLPLVSAFPQLSVRTYVRLDGRAGVWLLSVDAAHPLAVWTARALFHLPYHRARMPWSRGEEIVCRSARADGGARCELRYRPAGPASEAPLDSTARWLTQRYCLYSRAPYGELYRADMHHAPCPLQPVQAEVRHEGLLPPGLSRAGAPVLHFTRGLDVAVWSPERVR